MNCKEFHWIGISHLFLTEVPFVMHWHYTSELGTAERKRTVTDLGSLYHVHWQAEELMLSWRFITIFGKGEWWQGNIRFSKSTFILFAVYVALLFCYLDVSTSFCNRKEMCVIVYTLAIKQPCSPQPNNSLSFANECISMHQERQ